MKKPFGKRTTPPAAPQNQSREQIEADFLARCRPKLQALEAIRLAKRAQFLRRKKIGIPFGAMMTPFLGFIDYWLLMLQRGNDDSAAGLSVLGLMGLWFWINAPKRAYAKAYKTEILPDIAQMFGDFTYDPKGKIPMNVMKPSQIVPGHSGYKSEDSFDGQYKGMRISFSEIKLTKKSGKQTVTVFDGLAVMLSQGTRKFYGHTVLLRDKSKIGEWMRSKTSKLKPANLVDPEFEALFDVFTTDQVEARYLIDPVIIENIKALYDDYNGDDLRVAFYDDHVLILIASNRNHFEPADIHTPATDEAELLGMLDEIGRILSIVDQLNILTTRNRRLHRDAA